MAEICEELTKTRTLIEQTIQWANRLERLPVVYLLEDRAAFRAGPAPVLEFVYHASGSEIDITLGPYHYVSRPGTVLILSTCQGYCATPGASVSVWNLSLHIGPDTPVAGLPETPLLLAARAPVARRRSALLAHCARLVAARRTGAWPPRVARPAAAR